MKKFNYLRAIFLQKKWTKLRLTGLLSLLIATASWAQTATVTGTVKSSENNESLPGVSILVKGTSTGVITDVDGAYAIEASSSDILVFSYVGYVTEEVEVGSRSVIDLNMTADVTALEEIVVIGYGTVKKSDLTGAVSSVSTEDFERQPLNRLEQALQGRAAGVSVQKQSGAPGGAIKVRVRGANSINGNNDPLIVIDGIIGGSDLQSINPNDIASMEVLKDASATAIYGSRGANGVILITTKTGKGQSKLNVEYFTGVSQVPNLIPTLGAADFARIENSRRERIGGSAIFSDSEISALEQSGGTNYQDELLENGTHKNFQLSASGSEGRLSYFISGNYVEEDGMILNTGYKRYSGRSNLTATVSDKIKIGLNIFAVREETKNEIDRSGISRYQGSLILQAITWDPTTPVYDSEGNYNLLSEKSLANLNYNPVARLNTREALFIRDRLNVNFNLDVDIVKGLSYKLIAGVNTFNSTNETYDEIPNVNAFYGGAKNTGYQVSNLLTYQNEWGRHNLKVLGVYEIQSGTNRNNGYSATDISVPGGFYFAELAQGTNVNNNFTEGSIMSYMGRAEYIYNNALYLTGSIRVDNASVFRPENRTGTFPSIAAKYSFNNMAFVGNSGFLSQFAVRAGWGQTGSQNVARYSTYPTVSTGGLHTFDGTSTVPGTFPASYGNPDLTWETTTQTNIGVDFGFFSDRLSLSIDAYQKNTTDLLLDTPVPLYAGGGIIRKNIGEVQNQGVDIMLTGAVIDNANLRWDATFTYSRLKNEIVDLGGEEFIQGTFQSIDGQSRYYDRVMLGESMGQLWGVQFLGTWKQSEESEAAQFGQTPGDAKYLRDENGEIVEDVVGNGMPKTTWGFNNNLTYKKWDMNVFFTAMHDYQIYNIARGIIIGSTGNQRSFMHPEQLDQWTASNETDIPAGGANIGGSSRNVENGGFVRLSNLSLGYTFEFPKIVKTLNIYASGQNLFVISDYSGYDPEATSYNFGSDGSGSQDTAQGIDTGAYPIPRVYVLGVKFGF